MCVASQCSPSGYEEETVHTVYVWRFELFYITEVILHHSAETLQQYCADLSVESV